MTATCYLHLLRDPMSTAFLHLLPSVSLLLVATSLLGERLGWAGPGPLLIRASGLLGDKTL